MNFNLETAISAWRHQFKYQRFMLPEDLDELERHLRDKTSERVGKGQNEEAAFRSAMKELGDFGGTDAEYRKVYWGKIKRRHQVLNEWTWRLSMLKNYLKLTVRNLVKHKTYSVINIGGLAVGMAVCVLILIFVRQETTFDEYHEYQDRIYRIQRGEVEADGSISDLFPTIAPSFIPLLEENFPEFEQTARLHQPSNFVLTYGDRTFLEEQGLYAEENLFEILTVTFTRGEPSSALVEPGSIVLSETTRQKYFGNEDALGKELLFNSDTPLTVTGIFKDSPRKTHLHFDFLVSYKTLSLLGEGARDYFMGPDNFTDNVTLAYVRLARGVSAESLAAKIPDLLDSRFPEIEMSDGREAKGSEIIGIRFMPVPDIHLRSITPMDSEPAGSERNVRILTLIALFVLLIACINYMNLSTATAAGRAREVGLRKVVGADKKRLIIQYLSESSVIALIALCLAVGMVALALPAFGSFVGYEFSVDALGESAILFTLFGVFVLTGIVSGLYPALYISAYRPVTILRGELTRGKGGAIFRKVLVIFQFAASIVLIVSVGIVYKQMEFMRGKDLGFDQENIALISLDQETRDRWNEVKDRLETSPFVMGATISKRAPSAILGDNPGFQTEVYGEIKQSSIQMPHNRVGFDFFSTYGMKIIAGRDFSEEYVTDEGSAFIINETAVRQLGWRSPEEALGSPMSTFAPDLEGTVIGVVQDFNYESLRNAIIPVVTYIRPGSANTVAVRLTPGQLAQGVDHIEAVWNEFRPGTPVEITFLDERIDALYQNEARMMSITAYFSLLAVFIACLGLFGLATFMAERRTREVGIRKVFGASGFSIMSLLSTTFVKWVLVANVIAWPIAYFLMKEWQQTFAYKAGIGIEVFVLATLATLLISVASVSYQTSHAARAHPIDSIRYESG